MLHRTLLALPFVLALGCDNAEAPKKTANVTKPADAKPPGDAKASSHGDPKAPPADAKAAANPHGAMGGAPMMPKAEPKGPPRDVTPSGEVSAETLKDSLGASVPTEWEKGTPSSGMRAAQWVVPGPGGDAELVVFFAPGGMGTVEQNIARWKAQFAPPEGKTLDDISKLETSETGGLKINQVDVSGRFVAAVMPGADEKHDDADYRMIAAVVEGTEHPFYFKAVGPKATMDIWADAFAKMFTSLKKTAS